MLCNDPAVYTLTSILRAMGGFDLVAACEKVAGVDSDKQRGADMSTDLEIIQVNGEHR